MFIYRKRSWLRQLKEDYFRLFLSVGPILIGFLIYIFILIFSSRFRFTVFLFEWVPVLSTALSVAAGCSIVAAVIMFATTRRRRKIFQEIIKPISFFFIFIGLPALTYYDYYVWFLSDNTVRYVTEYDVTFPGPSRGKSGHCEAGLLIKDKTLNRWITLCSSKAQLQKEHKQGMDGIYVVENVSRYGIRLIDTEFTWL
ncbi:hypothetical protein EDF78_103567 [Rahnella sp. BIGb0236]|uniref:hypothetical protein n=1 Tax=Rahnella sp. BIGb0236 TaxID=2485117 RepID=UPI00105B41AB|nr:hypothetical protein [Rahnella sp. BIGb0236]TDS96097.1 hypothetical protein EDF78_103567 [Rahnella sp. BIGb0236]